MKLKLVKTVIGKHKLVCNYLPEDRYIGQRIALGKYEPYLSRLMLEQIKEGDVVIDVGANIGYYSMLFSKKVGEKGRIYAFEPDKTNYEILVKNIRENKLKNVKVIKGALGSKNSIKTMFKSADNLGDHRLFSDKLAISGYEKIKVYNLDNYLKKRKEKRKINLIKIDTQGWEPEVMLGAKKTIEKFRPTIFFEYWPWAYKMAGLNKTKMMAFLRKIYGQINFIEEYIQVYFPIKTGKLDQQFADNNEKLYGNLWVKGEIDWKYWRGSVKDFWLKKMMKRILGKPQT